MPVRLVGSTDVLANALPRTVDERVDIDDTSSVGESIHTARLYSDVSDDEFSDCNFDFTPEVNQLERDYFDALHVEDVANNYTYAESPVIGRKSLSAFEREHFHEYNVTPDRPCSAFFKTDSFMPATEIFDALGKEGFKAEHIRCLQRKPSGEIFLTFRTHELRNAFLEKSSFVCHQRHFTANDDERPLTFLTIYDAPYELSDSAIIHRLSPYCEVVWYRRGTFRAQHGVFNGLRHYRVRISHAIPSYLRFGKFQIRLYHDGQTPTCRRCNRSGHKAANCRSVTCFNCDGLGHTSTYCIKPMYCCICKSGQHLARSCPLSWHRQPIPASEDRQAAEEIQAEHSDHSSHMDEEENSEYVIEADNQDTPVVLVEETETGLPTVEGPAPPKRPLVVDPESILAEQCAVEDPPVVSLDDSPSPPVRVLDSQGLIVDDKQNKEHQDEENQDEENTNVSVSETPTLVPDRIADSPNHASDKVASHPSASTSWAEVADRGAPPLVVASSLPQRVKNSRSSRRKPATVPDTRIPTRRSTQPAIVTSRRQGRVPTSSLEALDDSALSSSEQMDIATESRKRKDPPEVDS